ncbi:microfibril-associated glycoprotein 4-like [Mytilus edulis]|uniref:microfibril-associated glycoprotein 4-like n=1 Tax=Mytilus edulis TaxID=6550 RepID=UPI0039EEADB3
MLTIFTLRLVTISYLTISWNIQNVLGLFQKNKQMGANVIFEMENRGPTMCLRECTHYKGCSGVNYRRDTLTCQLLSVSLPGDQLKYSEVFSFSDIYNFTLEGDSCLPTNPCKEREKCVPLDKNGHVCVSYRAPCDAQPCKNGGICLNQVNSYLCTCPDEWTGPQCETNICDVKMDCSDLKSPICKTGIYQLNINGTMNVLCEMNDNGGGWTVFQKRQNGNVDFYRDWDSYKLGFGNMSDEFWLGNTYLHLLTNPGNFTMRIELEDFDGNHRYAEYTHFSISDESSGFKLKFSTYTGDAGDALTYHNGQMFSTKDKHKMKCAQDYKGAWWYNACHRSNLNGLYLNGTHTTFADGVNWKEWKGHHYSLKSTRMMFRKA